MAKKEKSNLLIPALIITGLFMVGKKATTTEETGVVSDKQQIRRAKYTYKYYTAIVKMFENNEIKYHRILRVVTKGFLFSKTEYFFQYVTNRDYNQDQTIHLYQPANKYGVRKIGPLTNGDISILMSRGYSNTVDR